MMVLQEGSGFNELRNTMDSLEQNKCFKNSREVRIDQESVCEGKERETVETLQSAFLKFKRNRQKLHQVALADKKQIKRSDEQTDKLRQKFIEQLKHYIGVPYARRYHEPGSAEYDSPLFLDCCGLVRKVLRDMKEDFGFSIGPWNQAYMFDTLPNSINDTKDMKPGDLVFVSGTFYNPKKRKQKHNIVHVEIWAGDGEKTIGARWQKGKVQVHESYQYVSKSYYNMVYHFKSIDTWLNGICKSFCPQHSWTLTSSYIPGRKSIFSTHQADELADGASEEQFTEENQKYIEKRGTCFEGKCSEKKVQDDKQGDDEEKSDLVGKAAPEQENISYVQENKFYCETILSCYAENFTSDVVAVENEPKGCKIKNRENAVDRNVVFVRKDRQEKNKLNDKKEDILDHECADFHVVDQVNMPNLRQREFNAKEPISCKKNEENFRSKPFQEDCERCTSNADISQFEEEDSEHCEAFPYRRLLIGSELVNDNDHLDTVNDYPGLSLETIDLCWSDVREGKTSEGVTFNNTIEQMTDFRSRPNSSEAAGAAGTRKHVMTTQAVNRRGKGTVSPAYYLSDKQDFDVSSEDPSYGIRKGLRSRRQNLVCRLGGSRRRQNGDDDQSNNRREPSKPFCKPNPSFSRLHQKPPTFFIGGHNGAKMVEATLSSLGWERIHDKNDTKFYLKWVECKRNLDFASFREGEQLVNHIPNGNLLTTKIGLLTSLQKFERVSNTVPSLNRRSIHMKDFVPETFRLQNQAEIQTFIQHIYQDGEMWICKPTGMNQGKGIFLIRSRDELLEKLGPRTNTLGRQGCFPAPGRVIQRYILNPFLLNGYKADIRTYMLIAGTTPYMVFYHPGYIRLSLVPFSLHQEEVHAHLTNQYIQKKHPLYEQVKEKTVWSMEQLQEYLNKSSNNTLPPDWVYTTFTKRMEEIMLHCFQSVRYKLDRKLGYFDLLGFDFMLDENMNVWLIEINVNPALHTNCKILSGVIPELVDTTLRLVLEVFEKSKRKEKVFPLENQGKFQLIFSDEKK